MSAKKYHVSLTQSERDELVRLSKSQVLLPIDLHGGVEEHWKQSGQGFETIGGQLPQKGGR